MFSLIITIIAIALVAALAVSSIYYGGQAFSKGSLEAESARFVNGLQQVKAAGIKAKLDGNPLFQISIEALVNGGYLSSTANLGLDYGENLIKTWAYPDEGYADSRVACVATSEEQCEDSDESQVIVETRAFCDAINEKAGLAQTPVVWFYGEPMGEPDRHSEWIKENRDVTMGCIEWVLDSRFQYGTPPTGDARVYFYVFAR